MSFWFWNNHWFDCFLFKNIQSEPLVIAFLKIEPLLLPFFVKIVTLWASINAIFELERLRLPFFVKTVTLWTSINAFLELERLRLPFFVKIVTLWASINAIFELERLRLPFFVKNITLWASTLRLTVSSATIDSFLCHDWLRLHEQLIFQTRRLDFTDTNTWRRCQSEPKSWFSNPNTWRRCFDCLRLNEQLIFWPEALTFLSRTFIFGPEEPLPRIHFLCPDFAIKERSTRDR